MTLEEAQARIAELEAENAKLKNKKNPRRKIVPHEVDLKYPFCKQLFFSSSNSMLLSKFVRTVIFQEKQKPRVYNWKDGSKSRLLSNYTVTLDELTDKQYQTYCEVVEKIIGIIGDYREADA